MEVVSFVNQRRKNIFANPLVRLEPGESLGGPITRCPASLLGRMQEHRAVERIAFTGEVRAGKVDFGPRDLAGVNPLLDVLVHVGEIGSGCAKSRDAVRKVEKRIAEVQRMRHVGAARKCPKEMLMQHDEPGQYRSSCEVNNASLWWNLDVSVVAYRCDTAAFDEHGLVFHGGRPSAIDDTCVTQCDKSGVPQFRDGIVFCGAGRRLLPESRANSEGEIKGDWEKR